MEQKAKFKQVSKKSIFKNIEPIIIFSIIWIYIFWNTNQFLTQMIIGITLTICYYIFIFQYETTELILDYETEEFIIKYPLSIYLKSRSYRFSDIDKIHFNYSPGPYAAPRLTLFTKTGKKKKYYQPYSIEEIARRLQEIGIETKIK